MSTELTELDWEVLNYTEQIYNETGDLPTPEDLNIVFGRPVGVFQKIFKSQKFAEALERRGITNAELLTTDQLAGLAVFFDTKDGRSLKKKLNDIGVTTVQWDAWKRQPAFQNHMRTRAENGIINNIAETEVAIMDSAHRGDTNAAKLHLELAGRWSSKTVGELNVDFLLMRIMEIIQVRVKDLDIQLAIADDLAALSPRPAAIENSNIITSL